MSSASSLKGIDGLIRETRKNEMNVHRTGVKRGDPQHGKVVRAGFWKW